MQESNPYLRTRLVLLIFFLMTMLQGPAQPIKYTTANAHSHNDYENPTPFFTAFDSGFGSIEADIFTIGDSLFVAHSKQNIKPGRTLENLYLDPLNRSLAKGRQRKLILLVDIKDDYKISLPLLVKELSSLDKYLSDQAKQGQLTVVISGNRPRPDEYINYPLFIFFDDDLKLSHSPNEWKRVGLVSLPLYRITRWNGKDKLEPGDSLSLKKLIDSVHQAGKPIRFWAAPDTELSWQMQMNLKVDLIGTDKINELAEFLRKQMR